MSDIIKNQLIFKNSHAYDLTTVTNDGITRRIQGQDRTCIDAQFALDQFDAVKSEIAIDGNLDNLTIAKDVTKDDGTTTHEVWVHTNFNIVQHIGVDSIETSGGSDSTPAEYESRTSLMLAQLTYLEVAQKQQAAAQESQAGAIAELSILIAGGNA